MQLHSNQLTYYYLQIKIRRVDGDNVELSERRYRFFQLCKALQYAYWVLLAFRLLFLSCTQLSGINFEPYISFDPNLELLVRHSTLMRQPHTSFALSLVIFLLLYFDYVCIISIDLFLGQLLYTVLVTNRLFFFRLNPTFQSEYQAIEFRPMMWPQIKRFLGNLWNAKKASFYDFTLIGLPKKLSTQLRVRLVVLSIAVEATFLIVNLCLGKATPQLTHLQLNCN